MASQPSTKFDLTAATMSFGGSKCRCLLAFCIAVFTALLPAISAAADDSLSERWQFGWDGVVIVGRWTPATVEFTLSESAECQIEISALDAEGHTATFVSDSASLPPGPQRLTACFQCGRLDSHIRTRLVVNGKPHQTELFRPGQSENLQSLGKLADQLIVTAGLPITAQGPLALDRIERAGSPSEPAVHVIAREKPSLLPANALSYDCIKWLVIAGDAVVPSDVSEAIRQWVGNGGRLIVSIPKDLAAFHASPWQGWLPVQVAEEQVSALNFGELEALAGRSIRIPATGSQRVARLSSREGNTLASSRDEPLLIRAPYGFGEVTVLGLDITQPPLKNWGGLRDFVRNLVEVPAEQGVSATKRTQRAGQLTSTGISDLASQVHAALDRFRGVERPSPWWSMVWLLGLLILVGPLDYVLVHRVLHKPHATWITLPVWLIVAGIFAVRSSDAWNTSSAQSNQLDVFDVEAASGRLRGQSWNTFYSTETARHNLTQRSLIPLNLEERGSAAESGRHPTSQINTRTMSSFAIPETAFGGMYRPAGTEWDRTEYRVFPNQQRIEGLPTLQWSSRTVTSEWLGEGTGWVEGTLQSSGLGRLTGSITHHFSGELTDWILAYGSRAYRRQPGRDEEISIPWPAGMTWNVDDSHTFQRELRGVLTRSVTYRESEGTSGLAIRATQSRYDPLNRDLLSIWELLTFHEAGGGTAYSSLTNHLLNDHDLSRQLDLGRAVLFGRLSSAPITAAERDGTIAEPSRHDVIVRAVLPVRRAAEFVRDLPKLVK